MLPGSLSGFAADPSSWDKEPGLRRSSEVLKITIGTWPCLNSKVSSEKRQEKEEVKVGMLNMFFPVKSEPLHLNVHDLNN